VTPAAQDAYASFGFAKAQPDELILKPIDRMRQAPIASSAQRAAGSSAMFQFDAGAGG